VDKIVINKLPNSVMSFCKHLSVKRHYQFELLMGLMLISAMAEVVSLGAVLPFLGVLLSPDLLLAHPFVVYWGITPANQLVFALTISIPPIL
jgi:hypothetical protein